MERPPSASASSNKRRRAEQLLGSASGPRIVSVPYGSTVDVDQQLDWFVSSGWRSISMGRLETDGTLSFNARLNQALNSRDAETVAAAVELQTAELSRYLRTFVEAFDAYLKKLPGWQKDLSAFLRVADDAKTEDIWIGTGVALHQVAEYARKPAASLLVAFVERPWLLLLVALLYEESEDERFFGSLAYACSRRWSAYLCLRTTKSCNQFAKNIAPARRRWLEQALQPPGLEPLDASKDSVFSRFLAAVDSGRVPANDQEFLDLLGLREILKPMNANSAIGEQENQRPSPSEEEDSPRLSFDWLIPPPQSVASEISDIDAY